jgi:hypothetical protein
MKKIKPFFLVVSDEDVMEFTVLGPMVDDTYETNKTAKERENGRNVGCESILDSDGAIRDYIKRGFNYCPDKRIL